MPTTPRLTPAEATATEAHGHMKTVGAMPSAIMARHIAGLPDIVRAVQEMHTALLLEQARTNQLLEWLGGLVSAQTRETNELISQALEQRGKQT